MNIEQILDKVKGLGKVEAYNIADVADVIGVKSQMLRSVIESIENTHRNKKMGKKINPASLKYLDFEARNPKDNGDENVFIRYIN